MRESTTDINTHVIDEELYGKAVECVRETQTFSVSMLQRRLKINYFKASGLIDRIKEEFIFEHYRTWPVFKTVMRRK